MDYNDSLSCHRCFRDPALIDFIREEGRRGWCDWCGARNVYIIPLYEIGELFRSAASVYEPSDIEGDLISCLLQEDWSVFSEKIDRAPNNLLQDLTVAILKAGLDPKDYLADYPDYAGFFQREEAWLVEQWHSKAEAYFENQKRRNNLERSADAKGNEDDLNLPDQLETAFEDLTTIYEPGKILYRARIHKDRFQTNRFQLSELGAPPPDVTPAGRANRKKEPVLYLASDGETALSEVRAWQGAAVAIATMAVKRKLLIVSLLSCPPPPSPFFDDLLKWKLQLGILFDRLAHELSMPVIPGEEENMYFSTQYLCDWVKKSGYYGIEYPSAMGSGFNVALFNQESVEAIDLSYFRITGIKHSSAEIKNNDAIYEEGPFDYLFKRQPEGH